MTRTTKLNVTPALAAVASFLVPLLATVVGARTALAEGEAPVTADPHEWALWASCGVFFGAVILFLVASHRSAARELGRLAAIEKRLDVAERPAVARTK